MVEIDNGEDYYNSQLNEYNKRIIIDLAMPKHGTNLSEFLDYQSDSSEEILKILKIVVHGSDNSKNLRKQISIGIPAERFQDKGYNIQTLTFSIQ